MNLIETSILFKEKIKVFHQAFKDPSLFIRSENIPIKVREVLYFVPILLLSEQNYQIAIFFKHENQSININFCKTIKASSGIFKRATSITTVSMLFGENLNHQEIQAGKTFGIPIINFVDRKFYYHK